MAMLGSGQLSALMLNPDFGGLTIGGEDLSREDLAELAAFDAEQARHKRELDRLDREIANLDPSNRSRRLTLSNLRATVKKQHSEAMGNAVGQCMVLGIPIYLALAQAPLSNKLDALFERMNTPRGKQ